MASLDPDTDPKAPIVARLATRPDLWVLRGSLVTAVHIAPWPRSADDVDLIARPDLSWEDGIGALYSVLGVREHEVIWPETDNPGLRVVTEGVQVDLAFGDPLVPPPIELEVLGTRVMAAPIEALIAWKLHGLFELESRAWRPKDLSDLHDLLVRPPLLNGAALEEAIRVAFDSRDTPLWVVDRLLARKLGRSKGSLKKWKRYRETFPDRPAGDDLEAVVETVATYLDGHLRRLRAAAPEPSPFAENPALDEVDALVARTDGFRRIDHDDLAVFTYKKPPQIPDPDRAITYRERRERQLLRECRGLTFRSDGTLLSRKLHRFAGFSEPVPPGRPLAIEKLDGSMVSPLVIDGALRLVTRRGPSPLGDRATALLPPDAIAVFADLLERGATPILEWTSPTHRIVLRHAEEQLTLLAVRDHTSGRYWTWEQTEQLANAAGLMVPRCLGRIDDPVAFAADVRAQPEGEGWVLRWDDGTWMKLKSDRYRRLHRVVEGPDPERGVWACVLHGESALAREVAQGRGTPVDDAIDAIEAGLARLAQRIEARVASGSGQSRADFARSLEGLSPVERRLCFRVWDGGSADAEIREACRALLGSDFAGVRALVG